ncbi:hypothetical protein VTK73DRAFT_5715 [Phialemonium thermophilum]|uniref:Uncharacterized protein n=1 Tax=Phialemonium thermophilum TaxID=223376 RepID=A0ABR3XXV3_9PEZI
MCILHIWLFSTCKHSCRSKTICDAAIREQRLAEANCGGCWPRKPRRVCTLQVRTHFDSSPCRPCQRASREAVDREARRRTRAREEDRQVAERYGWKGHAAANGGSSGAKGRRDSFISSGLYRETVKILPSSEYKESMPPPSSCNMVAEKSRPNVDHCRNTEQQHQKKKGQLIAHALSGREVMGSHQGNRNQCHHPNPSPRLYPTILEAFLIGE